MRASERLRREGNELYSAGMDEYRPKAKQVNFQEALAKYNSALSKAADSSERYTAYKNIGLASWRLAQVTCTVVCCAEPIATTKFYYQEALKNLDLAYNERSRR